jgi:hypothetical protein
MTRLILSTIVLATIALGAPAFADPYGNALREAANAGQITPHGVWDGK